MANLVISGDSSGAVTLSAPAVSGTTTLTLPTTSGTLVVSGGAQTVEFAAGTVSAPSITFTGDTNTGIFSPSADAIAFTEGGVESMRITSAGDVGIGTASPSQKLHVVGRAIISNGTGTLNSLSVGTTSSGAGTNSGSIDVNGNSFSSMYLRINNTANLELFANQGLVSSIGTINNTPFFFKTNDSERMRINAVGNVCIGTTDSGDSATKLTVYDNTNSGILLLCRDAGNTRGRVNFGRLNGGAAQVAGNVEVNSDSASPNNGVMTFSTSNSGGTLTERMRLNATGALVLAGGSGTATGVGITFPATQNDSSDANTLDDYEEGTYTPTYQNFTVTGTPTITGRYIKIGRLIHFSVTFTSTGTIAYSASALVTVPFLGRQNSGNITMRLNLTSSAFNNNQSGAQCTTDEVSWSRFFVGSFTTTSAGQSLVFAGTYEYYI